MIENEIRFENDSNKSSLIGIALIVLAIAVYVLIGKSFATSMDTIKVDIASKTTQVNDLKTKLDFLNQSEQELQLTSEVQRLESLKAVPVKMNEDQVIKDLVQIAKDHQIILHSVSFSSTTTSNNGVGDLRLSSSFEGNYLDLTDFLAALEQNARIFKVDSINVQISKLDISNVERATFSLTIDTFFQK